MPILPEDPGGQDEITTAIDVENQNDLFSNMY